MNKMFFFIYAGNIFQTLIVAFVCNGHIQNLETIIKLCTPKQYINASMCIATRIKFKQQFGILKQILKVSEMHSEGI